MQTIHRPYRDGHRVDRSRPIFYVIQHIPSLRYYAGYKANTKAFFEDGGYRTSCQEVLNLIYREGLLAFRIVRIRYFDTPELALQHETRFLRRVNAAFNPRFFNQHNGDGRFVRKYYSPESSHKISMSLRAFSPERKAEIARRISIKLSGKSYLTEDGRRRISEFAKGNQHALGNRYSGKHSPEGLAAIAKAHLGKKHSVELKKKMSNNRKGKALGANNAMSNPENRAKVGASKIGFKKLTHPTLPFRWAKPQTPKWHELIMQGYK